MEVMCGISKATFLKSRVIPANDNDHFNDNKCALCWGSYDDTHPAVRVLPCNHVYGRDCLLEAIDADYGDLCIICRTPLYRASILATFGRMLTFSFDTIDAFVAPIQAWYFYSIAWHMSLPPWVQHPLRWLWYYEGMLWWSLCMLNYYTGLGERTPSLYLALLYSASRYPFLLLGLYYGRTTTISLSDPAMNVVSEPTTHVDLPVAIGSALKIGLIMLLLVWLWMAVARRNVASSWDRLWRPP